jgi:chromosome segregation ATPase
MLLYYYHCRSCCLHSSIQLRGSYVEMRLAEGSAQSAQVDTRSDEEVQYLRARLDGAEGLLRVHQEEISALSRELAHAAREMQSLNAELTVMSREAARVTVAVTEANSGQPQTTEGIGAIASGLTHDFGNRGIRRAHHAFSKK